MREIIIAGNWKMNAPELRAFAAGMPSGANAPRGVRLIIFPPFPYISAAVRELPAEIGAQDISEHEYGAYTGEVSAAMLLESGAKYTLVGHSERRRFHAETDAIVRLKARRALDSGLRPIICVGETDAERRRGETQGVISAQITAALEGLSREDAARVIIAYEPVWAIGAGVSASPKDAGEVCRAIREVLRYLFEDTAEDIHILYGGSMNSMNSAALLAQPDIDGGLIGSASLDSDAFTGIIKTAAAAAADH
ncbi:MAG: triose-phosphate isomerase [Oscillospiraceae bacterium]|jgi:triosephosphate isomerase|nr:triose-phosphate isomerase [Oscillospiraceae bacterium]